VRKTIIFQFFVKINVATAFRISLVFWEMFAFEFLELSFKLLFSLTSKRFRFPYFFFFFLSPLFFFGESFFLFFF
jgi:hypothetical protein